MRVYKCAKSIGSKKEPKMIWKCVIIKICEQFLNNKLNTKISCAKNMNMKFWNYIKNTTMRLFLIFLKNSWKQIMLLLTKKSKKVISDHACQCTHTNACECVIIKICEQLFLNNKLNTKISCAKNMNMKFWNYIKNTTMRLFLIFLKKS